MAIKYARDFAAGRRLAGANGGAMNRLYVVESVPTVTGGAPTTAALPAWCGCRFPGAVVAGRRTRRT